LAGCENAAATINSDTTSRRYFFILFI